MKLWSVLLLCLLTTGAFACQDDVTSTPPEDKVCAPGLVQHCPCLDGSKGTQRCASSGIEWEICLCRDAAQDMTSDLTIDMPAQDMTDPRDLDDQKEDMDDQKDMDQPVDSACITPTDNPTKREAAQSLYAQHCGSCHGPQAEGTAIGPAILEDIAEESDEELLEVIREGEDDMPPIPITDAQSKEIIGFLLWLAKQDGENVTERCFPDIDG